MFSFEADLVKGTQFNGWTYFELPWDVSQQLPRKGRINVVGFLDAVAYRSSLNRRGDGAMFMFVSQPMQKSLGKRADDIVAVRMEIDLEERIAEVPADLTEAFQVSEEAKRVFEGFSYSHKKELVDWISDAKKAETRLRRIVKAIGMLENYKK